MAGLGKRHLERFNLNVPAVVTLKNKLEAAPKFSTELKTRNICAGGAFIVTEDPMPVGTDVDIDLHLSFFTGNSEHERRSNIHVSGSVIRIEPGGMAIKFDDKYQIFPAPKDTAPNETHWARQGGSAT